ncbi:MAG: protein jag [Oscillospiraceae bacterium]|jgi:spoIIIJ-associated protein|nr:protein jag [Oscillospiraceae bacterium]
MIKTLQKSAKTEDEALRLALDELGLTRDDVKVDIIERAKSGFLGLGGTPAVITVTYEAPDDESETSAASKASVAPPESSTHSDAATPRADKSSESDNKITIEEKLVIMRRFLEGLFERYGVETEIEISDVTDGNVNVVLTTSEAGALIGKRGDTLDAIQHITNYATNRGGGQHLRITLDTENYRQKREAALEALAEKTATKVIRGRRNITLDPMNAYERHVIHAALQSNHLVSTYSVGSEPHRRLVVAYGKRGTADAPPPSSPRSRGGGNRSNSGSGGGNSSGNNNSSSDSSSSGSQYHYTSAPRENRPPRQTFSEYIAAQERESGIDPADASENEASTESAPAESPTPIQSDFREWT